MAKVVLVVPKWRIWICSVWCYIVGKPLLSLGVVSEADVSEFCGRMAEWVVDGAKFRTE